MTAVVDYGVGNLFSLCSSLRAVGVEAVVTRERAAIRAADRLILPGVGAFGDAADKLRALGLDSALIDEAAAGKPVLGICLGMQLLFERGFEYGEHRGLGLIEGSVAPMAGSLPPELKIPQMGWNALEITRAHPLLKYISSGDCVYFVHSYCAADCAGSVIATAEYGLPVTAAVAKGNVMGCQFHPEKSGRVGLGILRAFCEMGAAG